MEAISHGDVLSCAVTVDKTFFRAGNPRTQDKIAIVFLFLHPLKEGMVRKRMTGIMQGTLAY